MESKSLFFWNWFAVFYITLALLLLTLIPFNFKLLATAQQPTWNFGFQDFIQNLFLFFPLGVVLTHTLKRPLISTVLYGAFLSATIEILQLSDIGRTSNYCDIVSNALGVSMGYFYYRHFVTLTSRNTLDISLVFMLMPLCWFVSMRSATQEFTAWLVIPLSIVALSIFKSNLSNNRLKWLTLSIWLVFSLIPLMYISRKITILTLFDFNLTPGIIILVIVPLLVDRLSIFSRVNQRLYIGILCFTTILIIFVNLAWYLSKSSPVSWTVPAHLHWIDTLMSLMVLIFTWKWRQYINPIR